MGYINHEFPNANFYDSDLRELVSLYKELKRKYDGLQAEIQKVLDYIDTFKETTDELIKQEITIVMSLYTQRLIAVENMVNALEQKVKANEAAISKFQPQIDQLQKDLIAQKKYLVSLHLELLEEFHEYKNGVGKYIDGRLDAFETEIRNIVTKLDRLDVTNPLTGKLEDVNKVLADMFSIISQSYGITAKEYDDMRITAWEYDKLGISAIDYSTKAYLIFWELRQGQMRNPFTGMMAHYSVIINKLADLHKCTFTAKEYDELQMTAVDFDGWKVTAFDYDWFGKQLVLKREGITAKNYDALKETAEKYDKKELSAYWFDNYGASVFKEQETVTCPCMSCNPNVLQSNINKM